MRRGEAAAGWVCHSDILSWVTVLWPPGRYLPAEVSQRLRGSPGRGSNSGRPSRARQLEVEGPGSSGRPCKEGPGLPEPASGGASSDTPSQAGGGPSSACQCTLLTHNGPGGPVSTSNRRIRAPACLKHPGNNTRTADHAACSTPQQPRGHAARANSVAIVRSPARWRARRRAVLPRWEYSKYPCEYSEYQRGPGVVRMADGQSCRTAAAVRRNHPRAGGCTRSTRLRR